MFVAQRTRRKLSKYETAHPLHIRLASTRYNDTRGDSDETQRRWYDLADKLDTLRF